MFYKTKIPQAFWLAEFFFMMIPRLFARATLLDNQFGYALG